jgi:hypothetical protein
MSTSDRVPPAGGVDHRDEAGMANPDVYPAEEFAGFDGIGEFPEWHPELAPCKKDAPSENEPH